MGTDTIIRFGTEGQERKRLVDAICAHEGAEARYLGTPGFSYRAGRYTVDREGGVTFDEGTPEQDIAALLESLGAQGFTPTGPQAEPPVTGASGLTVSLPADALPGDAVANIRKLVTVRGGLIRKALGADRLDITEADGKVSFPWWDTAPEPEDAKAFTMFLSALARLARDAKRVNSTEREPESEKYAFRCFLIRLGFVGQETRAARKALLRRLSGSAAFPNEGKAAAFREASREKRMARKGVRDDG